MKIEKSLNPNCSEAVMRIDTTPLSEKKETELFKKIEKAVNKYAYETYCSQSTIFNKVKVIEVSGDMPFNDLDTLKAIVSPYVVEYELIEP